MGDEDRLKQFDNAIKFTPNRGRIELFMGCSSRNREENGAGLGLSIARWIVIGIKVQFESIMLFVMERALRYIHRFGFAEAGSFGPKEE